jgi:hypothetical protein
MAIIIKRKATVIEIEAAANTLIGDNPIPAELEVALAASPATTTVINAFMAALSLGKPVPEPAPEPAPWDIDEDYSILDALKDFAEKKKPKQQLMLVHRHTVGCTYTVKSYDQETGRAVLEGGFKGGLLKPVLGEREATLYYPVWV